ncbi:plasmid mobilization protein [Fibrella forsythiae]|uniref:Toxin-antitoxin system HicB family antitoxin n=1 Tax=Fibrella forsythiae TaxID=2817061 RepID=A0ABS3JTA6_9BACT|nr:hypothetical protein [Fibrella forsythiae]MBO0953250.1 hypothetical protein [Fibrella forsythiae]
MEQKKKPPYQIRMSDELYKAAQKKAKLLGLSFSAYVRMVVATDLSKSAEGFAVKE